MNIIDKIFDKTNNFFDKYFEPKRQYKNAAKNAHNYNTNKATLALLKAVDKIPHEERYEGICTLVVKVCESHISDYDIFHQAVQEIKNAFAEWPEYSGDQTFPVPAPTGYEPPVNRWSNSPNYVAYIGLLRWEGEYGAARQRLLDWLIVHFANKVHSTPYFPGLK